MAMSEKYAPVFGAIVGVLLGAVFAWSLGVLMMACAGAL